MTSTSTRNRSVPSDKIRTSIELVVGETRFNRHVGTLHVAVLAQPFAQAGKHNRSIFWCAWDQKANSGIRRIRLRVDRAQHDGCEKQ